MLRLTKVLFLVGLFLVVSVLWPYDPTTDSADALRQQSRSNVIFPAFDPPSFVLFEDKWGGESTKFIFLHDLTVIPGVPIEIDVPPGRTILPGTEYLLFTHDVKAADDSPAAATLSFRGANGAGWNTPLTGAVTKIPITEEMNDWSPDPNTRWSFQLSSDTGIVTVERLRLEIVKIDDGVPTLYEYDDRWDDGTVVRIHDERGTLQDARIVSTETTRLTGTSVELGTTPPDVPIIRNVPPRDIAELHVSMLYNSSSPTQLHYQPTLSFRGANLEAPEWEVQAMPPTLADPDQREGRFLWRVPIDAEMWDSPFAPQTRWQLTLNWRGDSTDLPVYMDGDYHFFVEVHKASGV